MYSLPASFRNVTHFMQIGIGDIVHVPVFHSYARITSDNLTATRDAVCVCLMSNVQVAHRPAVSMVKRVFQDVSI